MPEQTYTWNAEDYARHASGQYTWAQELIKKLPLCGTESILDIGCGDGNVTLALAEHAPQGSVIGIDASEAMIALANQRLTQSTAQNVAFHGMNATTLTFQSQFDVVFSNAALHWVKDHCAVLEGVKKILKPGGRLLFQMGGCGNAQDILAVFNMLMDQPKWRSFFTDFVFPYGFYSPEDYAPWLARVNLSSIRVELLPKDMIHASQDQFAGWIRTTWIPYIERVPQAMREEFIEEIVTTYLRVRPPDAQGKVHVKMVRLEVEAINPS